MKKVLKFTALTLFVLMIGASLVVGLFVNLSPQMGGKASLLDIENYKKSHHFKEGVFVNQITTSMDMGFSDGMVTMWEFIRGVKNSRPNVEPPLNQVDSLFLEQKKQEDKLIWFGHSAFLLQLEGQNILLDPMLGDVPAPHPALGQNRYNKKLPIEIAQLPQIDAVVLSHDHYDHLDYGSIMKLKEKTKVYYVPLGVGKHLKAWGIKAIQIHEMDWWDELQLGDLTIALTPSRHFSGRGLNDRFSTLWGSFVIKSNKQAFYFSGDGGYGPHFKEIGDKFGPFDLALVECGQYNEKWADIHMLPEESAQAGIDLNAKFVMPIHWGAFTLSLHTWLDPVQRILKKAEELNLPIITPELGEVVHLAHDMALYKDRWWQE